jgi:hypothetical protein
MNSTIGLDLASAEPSIEKQNSTQSTKEEKRAVETDAEKGKPYFPLAGASHDGWSEEDRATATCFCGAVQLSFVCTYHSCYPLSTSNMTTVSSRPGVRV